MSFIDWDVQAAQCLRTAGRNWDAIRQRIEKSDGDLTRAYMATNGGLMSERDAATFWKKNILKSKLVSAGTMAPMESVTQNFPIVGFSSSRISHRHSPGTALPQALRGKPDPDNVKLTADSYQAEVPIPDDVVWDNIEGEQFKNLVWGMAREKIMGEVEYYGIVSDTADTDDDLKGFDGILKSITTNTVDFGGSGIVREKLKAMLTAMPPENKGDKGNLKWITSINAAEYYEDQIAQLNLEIAAAMYLAGGNVPQYGYGRIGLLDIPVMPENIGTGSNKTVVLLGNPKGIYWGFHKKVFVEFHRDAKAGVTSAIFRYRFAAKPAVEDAWVEGYDVAPSP